MDPRTSPRATASGGVGLGSRGSDPCACAARRRAAGPLLLGAVVLALGAAASGRADPLTVIGFNVESGGADPTVVAEVLDAYDRCEVWGLSEVEGSRWATIFERAAERAGRGAERFGRVLGTTGREDRLLILYDQRRLSLVRWFELDHVNPGRSYRSPLVAELEQRSSGRRFLFMVNHLARGSSSARHRQAALLNRWARGQTLPIVAVGDYNFDWSVRGGDRDHDRGFDLLTRDGVFEWVRPDRLIRTQASGHQSVLDFVFVAGPARQWSAESHILRGHVDVRADDSSSSDHRPVLATFDVR